MRVTSPQQKIRSLVIKLLAWFPRHARDLPWRRTTDPYCVHVSEVMLQQTQVKTVIPYYERWMRSLPTIQSLAEAPPEQIHKLWEGLGYYTRVRNLQRAAQAIVAEHGGRFPQEFAQVLALPGIGRYTAGAICSIAFNQPAPILDGNVIRVLARVFGVAGDPRDRMVNAELWVLAERLVQTAALSGTGGSTAWPPCSALNQSLMELGALVCTPRQPKCPECPLRRSCVAFREQRTAELPNLRPRPAATRRRFVAFVVEQGGRFLVRQRPPGVVNAHLWEFPNLEVDPGPADWEGWSRTATRLSLQSFQPWFSFQHSITRYRITLEVVAARLVARRNRVRAAERWLDLPELRHLAFTGAHKRILDRLPEISCHQLPPRL
jgi:A/G-specific adenine glycosylase